METFPPDYLENALTLSESEKELRYDFYKWLPDIIIDCHAHANGKDAVLNISNSTLKRVHSSFPGYSIEDSILVSETLYLDKNVRYLRFANPYKGIDHIKANNYLLENSPLADTVALTGLPDNLEYTLAEIATEKYAALKMYLYYFEPPANKVLDYFPLPVLDLVQRLSIPIILHTPTPLNKCINEILNIIYEFPKLKIVLAHLGRHTHATDESAASYYKLAQYPQISADTSMATSPDVLEQVLKAFGSDRVMFGTDEPFNLLRYIRYEHPKFGERLVSTYPYHWLDENQRLTYGYLAEGAYHVHWQSLQAIRACIIKLYPHKIDEIKQMLFAENAMRVFSLFK